MKVYIIYCNTGCTCCSDENHIRGFYKTREDAEKRVAYYKDEKSKYWPLASQYARRGAYCVTEVDVEVISDNRVILENRVLPFNLVELNEDGTLDNNEDENLGSY